MSNDSFVAKQLPTLHAWLEKRREVRRNQLPEHLRPVPTWPIVIQIILNIGIAYSLLSLMWNRDDVFSEGKAGAGISVCMLLVIATLVQAIRYKRRYAGIPGQRLAKINFWVMVFAFLCLPAAISVFMN